jgi:endonuclease/exonuclease/phosphatase family metal-dependent hydrolase
MTFQRLLFPLLPVSAIFLSCSVPTGSDTPEAPTNIQLQVLEDGNLTVSWDGSFREHDLMLIARKAGENSWQNDFDVASARHFAYVDTLLTANSDTVFAYRLRALRNKDTSEVSATSAYFPGNSDPTDVFIRQTADSGLRITWKDHSIGESGFRIDRQINQGSWTNGYAECAANGTEFIDSDPPTTSSVAYRVAAYSGVSSSHTASGTLTLASLFFGTPETFDVMTWNLEDFPRMNGSTISVVSQALKALNPDIVGLQEMVSRAGFEDLLDSLGTWQGFRANSAAYDINLGFVYNPATISVNRIYEILDNDWRAFPRPPLVAELIYNSDTIYVINNHYKASSGEENESRRLSASTQLEEYIRTNLPDVKVIVLGDLNDELTDVQSVNVFWPFLSQTDKYKFTDYRIATGDAYFWSYPTYPSHIDHILITDELFPAFANSGSAITPLLIENFISGGWNTYAVTVSDHRPLALKLAL